MPPAVAAAGIMAAGTIGGAVLGGSAQKSAINSAAAQQAAATQAQLQLGQESLAQNRAIYNQNYQLGSPFIANGLGASNALTALLGVSPGAVPANAMAGTALGSGTLPAPGGLPGGISGLPSFGGGSQSAPVYSQNPLVPANIAAPQASHGGEMTAALGQTMPGFIGQGRTDLGLSTVGPTALGSQTTAGAGGSNAGSVYHPPGSLIGTTPRTGGTPAPSAGGAAGGSANALSPQQAFNNFANSAGMQFQLQQGTNALNNMYAARGMLQSGAALKGINDYAQQTALNNYFMPYMSMLGQQQAMGAGMASSVMGVGQNFGNTVANINGQMGSTIQNGANAASNAALAKGNANANMWSGIGSALGSLGSSFMPMGGGAPAGSGNIIVGGGVPTGIFG